MELHEEDESTTYKRLGDSLQIVKYGQGAAYGYFSREKLCMKEKHSIKQSTLPDMLSLQESENNHNTASCIDDFKMLSVIKI